MATVCASLVARVVVERETGECALKIESEASWHLPQIHCGFRARTTNSEQHTRYISTLEPCEAWHHLTWSSTQLNGSVRPASSHVTHRSQVQRLTVSSSICTVSSGSCTSSVVPSSKCMTNRYVMRGPALKLTMVAPNHPNHPGCCSQRVMRYSVSARVWAGIYRL